MVEVVGFAVSFNNRSLGKIGRFQAVAMVAKLVREGFDEMRFHVSKVNTVLWSLWTSKGWLNGGQIEFEGRRVGLLRIAGFIPQSLGSCIGFDASNRIVFTPTESHVIEGAFIDREEAAGCAIFRSHVGNCCAVC